MDRKRIIIALDFADSATAIDLLKQLDPAQCRVKIGKELFTRCGPDLVKKVIASGFEVFLDLKFHDIPNTVAKAVSAAADMGVWMVNVHASGGRDMMCAARAAVDASDNKPLLIAVTVLTSMSQADLAATGVDVSPIVQVNRLAALARECRMDGVVCSAEETTLLRANFGKNFVLVTPGIRPAGDDAGDQKRVVTPAEAFIRGSDYLVIGRPITMSANPRDKLSEIYKQICGSFPDLC
ncbi:MAG: orotidine-5'-phosphate decarboxylase [Gammaproteobacteria bacterium]|nr:orotidine-5'-phosphate decarboxylase [Gammaproteobacteria bacterium]